MDIGRPLMLSRCSLFSFWRIPKVFSERMPPQSGPRTQWKHVRKKCWFPDFITPLGEEGLPSKFISGPVNLISQWNLSSKCAFLKAKNWHCSCQCWWTVCLGCLASCWPCFCKSTLAHDETDNRCSVFLTCVRFHHKNSFLLARAPAVFSGLWSSKNQ